MFPSPSHLARSPHLLSSSSPLCSQVHSSPPNTLQFSNLSSPVNPSPLDLFPYTSYSPSSPAYLLFPLRTGRELRYPLFFPSPFFPPSWPAQTLVVIFFFFPSFLRAYLRRGAGVSFFFFSFRVLRMKLETFSTFFFFFPSFNEAYHIPPRFPMKVSLFFFSLSFYYAGDLLCPSPPPPPFHQGGKDRGLFFLFSFFSHSRNRSEAFFFSFTPLEDAGGLPSFSLLRLK